MSTRRSAARWTSRSGRRPSRASRRGTRRGARAGRVGTSSARRCRWRSSARASTSTAAATISCSRTTRTRSRRPKARATRSPRHWMHSGMVTRRREDVEVARQLHDAQPTRSTSTARTPSGSRCCRRTTAAQMELGAEELDAAAKAVERLDVARAARARPRASMPTTRRVDDATVDRFRDAMDDDFNTPNAVAAVFDASRRGANRAIDDGDLDRRRVAGRDGPGAGGRARARLRWSRRAPTTTPRSTISCASATRPVRRRTSRAPTRSATSSPRRGIKLEDTPDGTIWHMSAPARAAAREVDVRRASAASRSKAGARCASCSSPARRPVHELWLAARRDRGADRSTRSPARAGAHVKVVPRDQLDGARRARDAPQGVVALAAPIQPADFDELLADPARSSSRSTASPIRRTSARSSAPPRPWARPAWCSPRHRAVAAHARGHQGCGRRDRVPPGRVRRPDPAVLERAARAGVWCVGLDADGDRRCSISRSPISRSCSCSVPKAAACAPGAALRRASRRSRCRAASSRSTSSAAPRSRAPRSRAAAARCT